MVNIITVTDFMYKEKSASLQRERIPDTTLVDQSTEFTFGLVRTHSVLQRQSPLCDVVRLLAQMKGRHETPGHKITASSTGWPSSPAPQHTFPPAHPPRLPVTASHTPSLTPSLSFSPYKL